MREAKRTLELSYSQLAKIEQKDEYGMNNLRSLCSSKVRGRVQRGQGQVSLSQRDAEIREQLSLNSPDIQTVQQIRQSQLKTESNSYVEAAGSGYCASTRLFGKVTILGL